MSVDKVIESLENQLRTIAKSDMQQVTGNNRHFHRVNTVKRGVGGDEMTMMDVNILTPYAGDGYGMICAPRAGQNLLVLPLKGKESAPISLGRIFSENESIPPYTLGDFIIHHETHSELKFSYTQPIYDSNDVLVGHKLKLEEDKESSTVSSRVFKVVLDEAETAAPPVREGDSASIILLNTLQDESPDQRKTGDSGDKLDTRLVWKSKVYKQGEDGKSQLYVKITDVQLSSGTVLSDYAEPDIEQFLGFRILPDKGTVELKHYTGSGLYMEEYPDYALIDITDDDVINPRLVRYNVNAVIGDVVDDEDGVQLSKHRSKGLMSLLNYNNAGLIVREKQIQYRGGATEVKLQLQKEAPLNDVNGEVRERQIPNAEFVMEDITQDERDTATRVKMRQLSTGSVKSYLSFSDRQEEIRFQEASGLFGSDWVNTETVSLAGSGFVVEDFLKQYNEENKGWHFASVKAAEAQYKAFDLDFFKSAVDPETLKRPPEDGEYDLDYKTRIIPASVRRDVLLKVEGTDQQVPLLSGKLEDLTEENKALIGQKGYTYKTSDEQDTREDGYLCIPKGKASFLHYTNSGIDVRELEPDADFHAMQASFTLYNWDLGQYEQSHTFSKNRDEAGMLFGPYPIPMARIVMESAKYEIGSQNPEGLRIEGEAVIPTLPIAHTPHPQAGLTEADHSGRTTLGTCGETATWVGIEQYSSHIQNILTKEASATPSEEDKTGLDSKRFGSRLLFKDYVTHAKPSDDKTPLIAAAKWQNERGKKHQLLAPKGSVELQHYTGAGLAIYDKKQHYLNKDGGGHAMALRLSMRSFDFLAMKENQPVIPYTNDDGYFFSEMLSNEIVDNEEYKFELDEKFYDEKDSQRGKQAKEAHGKRAAKTGFAHGTTRTANSIFDARIFIEDYVIPPEGEEEPAADGGSSDGGGGGATFMTSMALEGDYPTTAADTPEAAATSGEGEQTEKKYAAKKIRVAINYKTMPWFSFIEDTAYMDITPSKGTEFYLMIDEINAHPKGEINSFDVTCTDFNAVSPGTKGTIYYELGYELGIAAKAAQVGDSVVDAIGGVVDAITGTSDTVNTNPELAYQANYATLWREKLGTFSFESGKWIATVGERNPFISGTLENVTAMIGAEVSHLDKVMEGSPYPTGRFIVIFDSVCEVPYEEIPIENPQKKEDPFKTTIPSVKETSSESTSDPMSTGRAYITGAEGDAASEDAPKDLIPSHIYKPKEEGKPRELLMPKGQCGIEFWNFSTLKFGDWDSQNEAGVDPDDLERGKRQSPFALTTLNSWNNQKIDSPDDCPAKPYDKASAMFHMYCNANMANFYGKDSVKIEICGFSTKVEDEKYGNAIVFEDFVTGDDTGTEEAYDTCNYYKAADTDGLNSITDYDTAGGLDVVIPDEIDGKPVEAIAEGALKDKGITSMSLSDSIKVLAKDALAMNDMVQCALGEGMKKIADGALAMNKLQEAILNEGMEFLGDNAFASNVIKDILLPSTLENIGAEAFANNVIENVDIPENVADAVGAGAFKNNEITDAILPANMTKINKEVFLNNKLGNINLPSSITEIGDGAFKNNLLSSLNIPSMVEKIGNQAFRNNKLTNLLLPDGLKSIGNNAFAGNLLSSIQIPDSVINIGKGAFAGIPIQDIIMGNGYDSVISAVKGAVLGHIADAVPNLDIPALINGESITKVAMGAFMNSQISNVNLPDGLTEIGMSAFQGNDLGNLNLPATVKKIAPAAFKDNVISNLNLPEGLTEMADNAFEGNLLSSVSLPTTLKKIAAGAFKGSAIGQIVIGRGVNIVDGESMGDFGEAFRDFYNLNGQQAGTYDFDGTDWIKSL